MCRQPNSLFLKRVMEVNSVFAERMHLYIYPAYCYAQRSRRVTQVPSAATDALKSCPPPDLFTLYFTRFPVTGS